jgi:TusA-related sulfurtransferase
MSACHVALPGLAPILLNNHSGHWQGRKNQATAWQCAGCPGDGSSSAVKAAGAVMAAQRHHRLSLKGLVSPFVHLMVLQRFQELKPGDTLALEHLDSESLPDLMAILKHYPLELGELQETSGTYRLQITKSLTPPS